MKTTNTTLNPPPLDGKGKKLLTEFLPDYSAAYDAPLALQTEIDALGSKVTELNALDQEDESIDPLRDLDRIQQLGTRDAQRRLCLTKRDKLENDQLKLLAAVSAKNNEWRLLRATLTKDVLEWLREAWAEANAPFLVDQSLLPRFTAGEPGTLVNKLVFFIQGVDMGGDPLEVADRQLELIKRWIETGIHPCFSEQ